MFVDLDETRKMLDTLDLPDYNSGECHPDIFVAQECPEFEAGPLRAAVLENHTEDDNVKSDGRVPYLLVVPKYQPITSLTCDWDQFMAAFFAIFYCHAMLWSVGIQHGAISESDLLWNPDERKAKLCDFDISHFCEPPQIDVPEQGPDGSKGFHNTGTWIFMAKELLTEEAMEGTVKLVYRHEVEAFVAALVWIACRYNDGKLRTDPPLEHWNQGKYLAVSSKRSRTFNEITSYPQPSGLPDSLWEKIKLTVLFMGIHQDGRGRAVKAMELFKISLGSYAVSTEMPEDFDDLRALHKMISWPLFTHPSAKPFVNLMEEQILNPDKQQETRA